MNNTNESINILVDEENKGIRIDKYLTDSLKDYTRSYIQKLITDGNILINNKSVKSNYKVNAGDNILIYISSPVETDILPVNIPLDIIYEDNDILIINKPKGMVVHPACGHTDDTLVNAIMYHCKDSLSGINGQLRPGIVHRIDKNTTGILVICKNDSSHEFIAKQLKVHSITRKYYCICIGNIKEDEGTIVAPIGRSINDRKKMSVNTKNGRDAITHFRVLERFGNYTFVECTLETGRTHQIRVHMASIHHPLLGDDVYGNSKSKFKLNGQTLHAGVLGFIHPSTKKYVEFSAPLPEYFEKILTILRKNS